ncbi:MAG: DUF669 domain-containing protein [bacterium]
MRIVIPEQLSLPPIPPGAYRATITDTKYQTSQNQNPMLRLELTLRSQGPIAEVNTVGRKVFDRIMLMEEAMWRLNLPFKAVTGQDLPKGQEFSVEELCNFIRSHVLNKDVVVNTDLEEYQGTMRERVKSYVPVS